MVFNKLGVMVDCSRNAVMTVDTLKKFISVIAKMGYNQVQLYTEDTYELDDEPKFGYLRGKYSKAELKELDDFAYNLGVELVPNIQTLAHMNAFLRWRSDLVDVGDILLVGEEKVYDLIERMFQTMRECFRTKTIHIGMDEAHMLGRGKYYDKNGPEDRADILCNHLQKVCKIAEKYDFQPMMWSDMFNRIAGSNYASDAEFDAAVKSKIPENLTLVYWDYYSTDKNRYATMIQRHRRLSDNLAFGGGASRWYGFAPHNAFSLKHIKASFSACMEGGIQNVFLTMWGDDGGECSSFAVLPALCYGACLSQGITKTADIKAKFQEWTGLRFDDFMLLDLPNNIEKADNVICPSKYLLYGDCFMSLFQNLEKAEIAKTYATYTRKLRNAAKRNWEYGYLFENLAALCHVLEIKQDICTRTRQAYANRELLDGVIADYKKMIKRTESFYRTFRNQWYTDNKPHGFDIQDIRLGGLLQRMRSCLERLEDFRDGKIASIPELEEPIVPISEKHFQHRYWCVTASTNVI